MSVFILVVIQTNVLQVNFLSSFTLESLPLVDLTFWIKKFYFLEAAIQKIDDAKFM